MGNQSKSDKNSKGSATTIEYLGTEVRTVADALAKGQVDLNIWEEERCVVNHWEVGMKLPDGSVAITPLWQVKVWLRRKISKPIELALAALTKSLPTSPSRPSGKKPKSASDDPHLLEVSVFDIHFGKLAWAKESGTDYDLKIAEDLYEKAVDELADLASNFQIDQVLFPIGQDFFHVDGWRNQTTAGTPMDVDSRWAKIFEVGTVACSKAIQRLAHIAPVHVMHVPGNHDFSTSWYMAKCIEAHFRKDREVSFDILPKPRKYYRYGSSLLGFTHGSEERHAALPNIMATEVPELWAGAQHREWHLGHMHIRRASQAQSVDSHEGTIVRVLPSLTGTDAWHYRKGYFGVRAAEAYLYSKDRGYVAHFSVNEKALSKKAK